MLKRFLPVGFACTPTTADLMGFFYAMNQLETRKKIKPYERLMLFEKFNFTCVSCNLYFTKPLDYKGKNTILNKNRWLEIDHIYPISKGGSDSIDNKQILCNVCNCKKSNKL